ncbi:MAG: hypothetical protein ACRCV9_17485, partial [Burkholderiaceae bacterium]
SEKLSVHKPTLWARLSVLHRLGFVSVTNVGRGADWVAAPNIKQMIQDHDASISANRLNRNIRYRQKLQQQAEDLIDIEVEAFVNRPQVVKIVPAAACQAIARRVPYSVFTLGEMA